MTSMIDWLNKPIPQDVLEQKHREGFWDYLDSPQFHEMFLTPLGSMVDAIGTHCLDVGCGSGGLAKHVLRRYHGIDGSSNAISNARKKYGKEFVTFRNIDFIEYLTHTDLSEAFDTVVFGGVLEVLVKEEHRIDFVKAYIERTKAKHFIVYDLVRFDDRPFDREFELKYRRYATANVPGLLEAKKHRKISVYKCAP